MTEFLDSPQVHMANLQDSGVSEVVFSLNVNHELLNEFAVNALGDLGDKVAKQRLAALAYDTAKLMKKLLTIFE